MRTSERLRGAWSPGQWSAPSMKRPGTNPFDHVTSACVGSLDLVDRPVALVLAGRAQVAGGRLDHGVGSGASTERQVGLGGRDGAEVE
jgi:hypothetical protein